VDAQGLEGQTPSDFDEFGEGFIQLVSNAYSDMEDAFQLCGLHEDGGVWCWRDHSYAEHQQLWPVGLARVEGLPAARELDAGPKSLCAITEEDEVICWFGCSAVSCGVDVSDNPDNQGFHPIEGLPAVPVQLALGLYGSCVRLEDGAVHCWGENRWGNLGDGTVGGRWQPALVPGLPAVEELSAGNSHVCAIDEAGAVYCWGANHNNQLGDGFNVRGVDVPTRVQGY
tara:strand:- start:158 stop:838 length:681 start_codon:yes stop_codon:yes gene_type:complete